MPHATPATALHPQSWLSAGRLFWQWAREAPALNALARELYPGRDPVARRRQWLLQWRWLRHYPIHSALGASFAHRDLAPVLAQHPRLLRKVYTPYVSQGLSLEQRVRWLVQHYAVARALMSPALFAQVFAGGGLLVCELALPNGHGLLPVRLAKNPRFESEGDMTLSLHDPFGTVLYAATLTLFRHHGHTGMLIGGIHADCSPETEQHLTRLTEGVSPAALLLHLLQALARQLGAVELRAVGERQQVQAAKGAAKSLVLDTFLREHGGRVHGHGHAHGYQLPLYPLEPADAGPRPQRKPKRPSHPFLAEADARMAQGLWRAQYISRATLAAVW